MALYHDNDSNSERSLYAALWNVLNRNPGDAQLRMQLSAPFMLPSKGQRPQLMLTLFSLEEILSRSNRRKRGDDHDLTPSSFR